MALVRNWMKEIYPKYKFSVSRHNYNSIHIYLVQADFEAFKKDKGVVFLHDVNHYYIDNDDTMTDRAKEVMKNVCDFVMSYNFDDRLLLHQLLSYIRCRHLQETLQGGTT